MGCELVADVNLIDPARMVATSEALVGVVKALIGAPSDIESTNLQIWQDVTRSTTDVPSEAPLPFAEFFAHCPGPNRTASWQMFLPLQEGKIGPGIQFFGEPDWKQRNESSSRQLCDALLYLSKGATVRSSSTLKSGTTIDPGWAMRYYAEFCRTARAHDLFLHDEAQVSFPPAYHGVYHLDPLGFVGDLFNMVRIALHGGEGYTDGRRTYPPAVVTGGAQYFYFGEIKRSEADRVCAMLTRLGGVVEREPERLTRLTAGDVRAAIQRCPGMIVRENDLGGLAVFPGGFPDTRIAPLYYHLLQEFAGP